MIVQTTDFTIPSDPAAQKKIRDFLIEVNDAMVRKSAEQKFISESIKIISDDFQIPKKIIQKMAKIYFNQNFDQVTAEDEAVATAYETIMKKGPK